MPCPLPFQVSTSSQPKLNFMLAYLKATIRDQNKEQRNNR